MLFDKPTKKCPLRLYEAEHFKKIQVTRTSKDINWIIKENLKKERLKRMDQEWVEYWKQKMITLKVAVIV